MPKPIQRLVDALCGWGWDTPYETNLDAASALLSEPELSDSFLAAVVTGDLAGVRAALQERPARAREALAPRGWPPLLYAAFSFAHQLDGRGEAMAEVVRALLDAGADPDAHYFAEGQVNGFSALYATIAVTSDRARTYALLDGGASPSDGNSTYSAVETFDLDLLRALCEAGIEHDDASYTIKHAIDMGWAAAVRLFLDHGADPNAVHPAAGETTLHWAVKRAASAEVIGWLLDAGADIEARTSEGRAAFLPILGSTPYDFALRLGHRDAVTLMEAQGAAQPAAEPALALVHAVARGDEAEVRDLLARDPSLVEGLPHEDTQLLPFWAQQGAAQAVRIALSLGFDTEAQGWMGLTALHWAALRGRPDMVESLLAAGVQPVDLGGYFGTPGHVAAHHRWYADGKYDEVLALLGES